MAEAIEKQAEKIPTIKKGSCPSCNADNIFVYAGTLYQKKSESQENHLYYCDSCNKLILEEDIIHKAILINPLEKMIQLAIID